ncbi:transmembrane protein 17B [Drosophila sulfurigaster albostrigata]|uniref:transmembrane protein 17B n=1 Tax=Drosophila sulfurigaster albostrigata TaxID=89887 RepID=UPI002D21DCF9|nr:transmembrane protein 17B [Drosophila sulfurigaster albostrigata]
MRIVTPQRSNLVLQMLLQINGHVSIVWACSYLLHMIVCVDVLWNYKGLAMLVAFVLATGAESLRLYAGYSINLCTGVTTMWLLLTLTPCVLLPTLLYLRLVAVCAVTWLQMLSNLQFLLITLEALVAIIHHALSSAAASEVEGKRSGKGKETELKTETETTLQ